MWKKEEHEIPRSEFERRIDEGSPVCQRSRSGRGGGLLRAQDSPVESDRARGLSHQLVQPGPHHRHHGAGPQPGEGGAAGGRRGIHAGPDRRGVLDRPGAPGEFSRPAGDLARLRSQRGWRGRCPGGPQLWSRNRLPLEDRGPRWAAGRHCGDRSHAGHPLSRSGTEYPGRHRGGARRGGRASTVQDAGGSCFAAAHGGDFGWELSANGRSAQAGDVGVRAHRRDGRRGQGSRGPTSSTIACILPREAI